jgi:hypothetical protein
VDRRWFTDDGDPRPDRPAGAQPPPTGGAAAAPEPAAAQAPPPTTSREFLDLIQMIASQAELMLTEAEGLPPHPEQARMLIDCLGALEAKTRGNLSTQESQLLSNLLFQLRSAFVQGGR